MVLLALPPADHLLIERDRGQFVPSRRRRMMANVRAERLLKIPAEPSPELRIHGACSSNARGLPGRNSARILGIRASFQRDNLRRHVRSSSPKCPATQSGLFGAFIPFMGFASSAVCFNGRATLKWLALAAEFAKTLAPYQSPRLLAHAIKAPATETCAAPGPDAKERLKELVRAA